jgi:glycosyltransferase involved in cell wall biosynthesis
LRRPGSPIYRQRSFLSILQIPFLCLFFVGAILRNAMWADIIHAQWTATALLALPAKWLLGKRIVVTARGSDIRLLPVWLNKFIHSRVDAAIDCFGPQPWNEEYKRKFPAHYKRLPLMVYKNPSPVMPLDMKRVLNGRPDASIFLYVGRFDYIKIKKNHLPIINLIHASNILKADKADFHVFYVGDGDGRIKREMLTLINGYSLADCVTILGAKINVLDYMKFCHLGLGGIALNAVSQEFTISGKPQILVNGIDNLGLPWRDGVNCILVEPDNAVDLAKKLKWAMKNRDRLETIGQHAKTEMDPYIMDSKTGGELYLRQFERLIAGA